MGFAPIKWTCTAFFRPRQLTDRAILAIRQTQEKKGCKVNQATQDDPRPALAVIQKVSVQRRRHGNFDSSTCSGLTDTDAPTHAPYHLEKLWSPLISVFRSNMLSPPEDAYPLVFAISHHVCLRWLLHIELCHDFSHNSDKKISIIDKLLQISLATKDELVNDCVEVARPPGPGRESTAVYR